MNRGRIALAALASLALAAPAMAQPGASEARRVALIIGETGYAAKAHVPNAVSDAQLIRGALIKAGFREDEITEREDVDMATLGRLVLEFRRRAQGAQSAVFYFAGHGKGDSRGDSWLLPIDIPSDDDDDLPFFAISVDRLVTALRNPDRPGVRLVLIDACRDRNFYRGGPEGFKAKPDALPEGVLAQTSTQPGSLAADGPVNGHSPYALALAAQLEASSHSAIDVRTLLDNVAADVGKQTKAAQTPSIFRMMQLDQKITILGEVIREAPEPGATEQVAQISEAAMWADASASDTAVGYAYYVQRYPLGAHVRDAQARIAALDPTGKGAAAADPAVARAAAKAALEAIIPFDWHNTNVAVLAAKVLNVSRPQDLIALAEAGDVRAQVLAGAVYELGLGGLPRDENAALRFYQMAAKADDPRGQLALGTMHQFGRGGLTKSEAEAVALYRKAADHDNAAGEIALAYAYKHGMGGLAHDEVAAADYYRRAAQHNSAAGAVGLGVMYENGLGGLARDDRQAVAYYQQAADLNYPLGQAYLGAMYEAGRGVAAPDPVKAVSYYRQAADQKNAYGQLRLGLAYDQGLGPLAQDAVRAVSLFREAADQGDPAAQLMLADAYRTGRGGVARNPAEAQRLGRLASGGDDDNPDRERPGGRRPDVAKPAVDTKSGDAVAEATPDDSHKTVAEDLKNRQRDTPRT